MQRKKDEPFVKPFRNTGKCHDESTDPEVAVEDSPGLSGHRPSGPGDHGVLCGHGGGEVGDRGESGGRLRAVLGGDPRGRGSLG